MKHKTRKVLAVFIAAAMCVSMFGLTALAASSEETEHTVTIQILYDDGNGASIRYGTSFSYTYTCAYSANHDNGANHAISYSDINGARQEAINSGYVADGYEINSWSKNYNGNPRYDNHWSGTGVSNSTTTEEYGYTIYLVATPTSRTFILSYDANGGEGAPTSQSTTAAATTATFVISEETPTREGYTFAGWATSANAEEAEYQPGDSIKIGENTTLYAVWSSGESQVPELETITVTYAWAGIAPEGATLPEEAVANKGAGYTAVAAPSNIGNYGFVGWFTDEACSTHFVDGTVLNEDTTLYGMWVQFSDLTEKIVVSNGEGREVDEEADLAGSTVELEMHTTVPTISNIASDVSHYVIDFHETLEEGLDVDTDEAEYIVTVNHETIVPVSRTHQYPVGEEIERKYYEVAMGENITDGCAFEINLDLTTLYNDGVITDEDMGTATISVYFFTTLEEVIEDGQHECDGWYTVKENNAVIYTSAHDDVEIDTYGIAISVTASNQPVEGRTFELYDNENAEGEALQAVTTDASGKAHITGLNNDTYYVKDTETELIYTIVLSTLEKDEFTYNLIIEDPEDEDAGDEGDTPSGDEGDTPSGDEGDTPSGDEGDTPSGDDGDTPSGDDGDTPSGDDGSTGDDGDTPSGDDGSTSDNGDTPSDDGSAESDTADKDALKDLVDEAEDLLAEAEDSEDVPEELLNALEDAINNAKAVLDDENASQEDIDAAYDALQEAMDAIEDTIGFGEDDGIDEDADESDEEDDDEDEKTEESAVAANTSSTAPQTGASLAALATTMALAAAGAVVVTRKKKEDEE